jgi:hypothetical protein
LRTRLNLNGWQPIATDPVTDLNGNALGLINVSVQYANGFYWIAGNGSLNTVLLYLSTDGLRYFPYDGASGVLINGGANRILTPSLQVLSPTSISIQFGYAPSPSNLSTSIQQWTFQLQ